MRRGHSIKDSWILTLRDKLEAFWRGEACMLLNLYLAQLKVFEAYGVMPARVKRYASMLKLFTIL